MDGRGVRSSDSAIGVLQPGHTTVGSSLGITLPQHEYNFLHGHFHDSGEGRWKSSEAYCRSDAMSSSQGVAGVSVLSVACARSRALRSSLAIVVRVLAAEPQILAWRVLRTPFGNLAFDKSKAHAPSEFVELRF